MRGVLVDGFTGAPIVGAEVRLLDRRVATDADGRFEFDAVEGHYDLELSAPGYISGRRVNVDPMQRSEVEARLYPETAPDAMVAAWQGLRTPRREDDFRFADEVGTVALALTDDEIQLPETIRVWRRTRDGDSTDSCTGTIEVLPLEEYVKGVVPREWAASWHMEALMAGALAARTYAVSHVLRGGRFECADVDDGTTTQVYGDDRSASTDEAVEATRGQLVLREGAIVHTEYSARNGHPTVGDDIDDPACAGEVLFGHGRGMCQNGTQYWATSTCFSPPCDFGVHGSTPKDHEWMVAHYYPGSEIVSFDPAEIEPCAELSAAGGVLDEEGPCFRKFGSTEYWRDASAGHDGHAFWTNAFESDSPGNWAKWEIWPTEAGRYRVEVYVDETIGQFGATRYSLEHAGGNATLTLDQDAADGWASLGEFDFEAGVRKSLSVFDNYSSVGDSEHQIAVDAIRLTRMDGSEPPEPSETDAGIMPPQEEDMPGRANPVSGGCSTAPWGSPTGAVFALVIALCARARRRPRATHNRTTA